MRIVISFVSNTNTKYIDNFHSEEFKICDAKY